MGKIDWEKRTLGRTGFEVTVLCIGGAWLGNLRGSYDDQVGIDTVMAGLEAGINLIDTSDNYIDGRSEGIVGRALEEWWSRGNRREDLILSSKVSVHEDNPEAFTYEGTMRSFENSLRELRTDYLDMFLVHDPTELSLVLADDRSIGALRKLKEQGSIRAIGLGCRPHELHRRCIETGEFDVSLTFQDYSLLGTTAEAGVLEPAGRHDVGVMNASINYSLGVPADADRYQRLERWCLEREVDVATLNLHFSLREKRFASTLIGFSRPARVEQNLAAYAATVDDAVWDDLQSDLGVPVEG